MKLFKRFWETPAAPYHFHGGLTLPAHKTCSTQNPVQNLPLSATYWLSLRQRDGQWLAPCVRVGEHVDGGSLIATPTTDEGVNLHAPTSGIITAIEPRYDRHSSNTLALTITLQADGADHFCKPLPSLDERFPREQLRARVSDCGVVGLGGAGFPTARKLALAAKHLVINAAECEPYISCDDMQIREHAAQIVRGAQLSAYILSVDSIHFGIENDKPQAIAALEKAIADAADPRISLTIIPARYPSGNSRQLFELLFNVRVNGKHAHDRGFICHNTATMKAVYDALTHGRPLLERYVTVSGSEIARPQVYRVRIGTPLTELIAQSGGTTPNSRLLIGGSMMGEPQLNAEVGLTKTTNCLLLLPETKAEPTSECIRCGRCSDACPMHLLPQQLYWYSRQQNSAALKNYRLFDCIECGICASVCPSRLPLVDYYRVSKDQLRTQERNEKNAARAQKRHQARLTRLAQQAAERKQKMQEKRAQLQTHQAQFAAETASAEHFDPTRIQADPQKQKMIAEAKARAEARRAARQSSTAGKNL